MFQEGRGKKLPRWHISEYRITAVLWNINSVNEPVILLRERMLRTNTSLTVRRTRMITLLIGLICYNVHIQLEEHIVIVVQGRKKDV